MRYGEAKRLIGYMRSQGWHRPKYRLGGFRKVWFRDGYRYSMEMADYEVLELKRVGYLGHALDRHNREAWHKLGVVIAGGL